MPKITYIDFSGNKKTTEVEKGLSVMEGAIQNNIPGIDADCGGGMACAFMSKKNGLINLIKLKMANKICLIWLLSLKKIVDSVVK